MAETRRLVFRIIDQTPPETLKNIRAIRRDLEKLNKALPKQENLRNFTQALSDIESTSRGASKGLKATVAEVTALNRKARPTKTTVGQVEKGLKRVGREAKKTATSTKSFNSVLAGMSGGAAMATLQSLLGLFRATGDALGALVARANEEFGQMDAAITEFSAKSNIGRQELEWLADASKEYAAVTSQTPGTVAELGTALLTLGASAQQVEENLGDITKLSDTIQEDPVLTGKVIQTGVNIFGEMGETAGTLGDKITTLINTTAAGSTGGVAEFFRLYQQAGSIAAASAISFDELAGSFATLRDFGVSARVASTALRNVIAGFAAPTGEAQALMEGLGMQVFDTEGNFVGMEAALTQFRDSIQNLGKEEQINLAVKIFGRQGAPAVFALLQQLDGKFQTTMGNLENSAGQVDKTLEVMNQSIERQALLLSGLFSSALADLGQSLAPVRLTVIQLAKDVLSETARASDGLDEMSEAGERLRVTLTENPEVAKRLGEAFAVIGDEVVSQIAQILDALTAFFSEQENVEQLADNFENLAGAVRTVGQVVRFVIALADGIAQLQSAAEGIPIIGDNFDRFFDFPTPINFTIEAIRGLFEVLGALVKKVDETLTEIGINTDEVIRQVVTNAERMFPILKPLIAQVERVLNKLAQLRNGDPNDYQGIENLNDMATATGGAVDALATSAEGFKEAIEDPAESGTDWNQLANDAANVTDSFEDASAAIQNTRDALKEDLQSGFEADERSRSRDEEDARLKREKQNQREINALKEQGEVKVAQMQKDLATELEARSLAHEEELGELKEEQGDLIEQRQEEQAKTLAEVERQTAKEIASFEKSQQRELQSLEEDFQEQQQSDAKAFQQAQQQAAEAHQDRMQQKRDQANREFDALQLEVERRLQIAQAETAEERANLERQFAEEDEAFKERLKIEQQVLRQRGGILSEADREGRLELSPLEQARADFEAQLQQEEKAFQEGQQVAAEEFQKAQQEEAKLFEEEVMQPLREEQEEILYQKRAELEETVIKPLREEQEAALAEYRKEIEQNVIAPFRRQQEEELALFKEQKEGEIAEVKKGYEEEAQRIEEEFNESERQKDRDAEDAKIEREKTHKQAMRDFDLETAEMMKNVLESTQIPAPEVSIDDVNLADGGDTVTIPERRHGGAVEAGQVYRMGEGGPEMVKFSGGGSALVGVGGPQLVQPMTTGVVYTAGQTAQLIQARQAPASLTGGARLSAGGDGNADILARLDTLTKAVNTRPAPRITPQYHFYGQGGDALGTAAQANMATLRQMVKGARL